ncbi:MAG: ABC transporter substrate-binding protein [Hyphomicrobiaceae bacterium]|nr:ABC transporter substrate-binding protein [Hyphomicrobiaceae bacterium]
MRFAAGRLALLFAAMIVAGAGLSPARAERQSAPHRVVSMNLCTDQLALLVAARGQLVSLSVVSHDPHTSMLADAARRYPANNGFAEEIFVMRPDLVVTGTFTRAASTALLRRLGYRVEVFQPAASFADIRANLARMGRLLGQSARTAALLAAFDAERARLAAAPRSGLVAALYEANSFTSGRGTLAAEIVRLAGLGNLADRLGLSGSARLPLELLVLGKPDIVVRERPRHRAAALAREVLRHPALTKATRRAKATAASDPAWICGLPFALGAVRRLAKAAGVTETGDPRR